MANNIKKLSDLESSVFCLKTTAEQLAELIKTKLSESNTNENFLVGFHIRHFLDTNSPTYIARHSDSSKDEAVNNGIKENKEKGKHTLNHLIDSLYKGTNETNTLIHIAVSFEEDNENNKSVSLSGFEETSAKINIASDDFFEMVPQISKLLNEIGLDTNFVNIKALYNAIGQLKTYKEFGKYADVIVLRPKMTLAYVVGITVVSEKADLNINSVIEELNTIFESLNSTGEHNLVSSWKSNNNSSVKQISDFEGIKSKNDLAQPPKELLESLLKEVISIKDNSSNFGFYSKTRNEQHPFYKTLAAFLGFVNEFVDEQVEGRKLTYGFVLGNPGLFDFLQGRNVFPCITDKSYEEFLKLDNYQKNYHLFSNHLQTALIIPYYEIEMSSEENLPLFYLNIENFEQDIFNWDDGSLIHSDYRPYAYLSYRFPWAVSAVVGSGSQIRVFSNGKIFAYRDGKGWKIFGQQVDKFLSASCWNDEAEKKKVKEFVNLACLLSPIYNPTSHGGFLTFCKNADNNYEILNDQMESLANQEPKWTENSSWLKKTELFPDGKINYETAKKIIQVSTLDGAIVFVGENFTIKDFGVRLSFPKNEADENIGGTKTTTAKDFAKWCQDNQMETSFSIAISSDGMLRIFHAQDCAENPVVIYDRIKRL